MATWITSDNRLGLQSITETSTTKQHELGTIVRARDTTPGGQGEGEFIYLLGVASTVVGSMVVYNLLTHQTTLAAVTAATSTPVAFAMSANVASQYGWYQISGMTYALKTAVKVAPGSKIYQSGTAGRIMSTSVAGKAILGATGAPAATVASATSTALIHINRPHSQGPIT